MLRLLHGAVCAAALAALPGVAAPPAPKPEPPLASAFWSLAQAPSASAAS